MNVWTMLQLYNENEKNGNNEMTTFPKLYHYCVLACPCPLKYYYSSQSENICYAHKCKKYFTLDLANCAKYQSEHPKHIHKGFVYCLTAINEGLHMSLTQHSS